MILWVLKNNKMKKYVFFILLVLVSVQGSAQDLFFKVGINQTTYDFRDKNGDKLSRLNSELGQSYTAGLGIPLFDYWAKYEIGLTLDAYNGSGGDLTKFYTWNTNYGGVQNTVTFFPIDEEITLGISANLGVSTILNGTQILNNSRYSLTDDPEFNGARLHPGFGVSLAYNILENGYLSFQYDYSRSISLRDKTAENLNFITNRILFGIHFQIY
jgi:hypothetical protein